MRDPSELTEQEAGWVNDLLKAYPAGLDYHSTVTLRCASLRRSWSPRAGSSA
jgi:hypothetical protein